MTRRDFIGATLAAAGTGAALAAMPPGPAHAQGLTDAWTGPGGVGDYARANGNTASVVNAAHRIRDRDAGLAGTPADTGETYDLVVVGGGVAGLSAAYVFARETAGGHCLVLDNHEMFGGESRGNQVDVDGVRVTGPQGANQSETLAEGAAGRFQRELGLPEQFEFGEATGTRLPLRVCDDHYDPMFGRQTLFSTGYFLRGAGWFRDPGWSDGFAALPWPDARKRALSQWFNYGRGHAPPSGGGSTLDPRPFHPDADLAERTPLAAWLDTMTYADYVRDVMGLDSGIVAAHMNSYVGLTLGGSIDTISAYAARMVSMPGVSPAAWQSRPENSSYSLPMGNAIYPRLIVRALLPKAYPDASLGNLFFGTTRLEELDRPGSATRIRLGATVAGVAHDGDPRSAGRVAVDYERGGRLYRVHARRVVIACGSWIARRIVKDAPPDLLAALGSFNHSPVLVANVAVRHWRYLDELGIAAARWFDGFGFTTCLRRPLRIDGRGEALSPDRPTMLTFYVTFMRGGAAAKAQSVLARTELFDTSFGQFELQIRRQMQEMFGSHGFDARRDIAGIVLNRWGHAFVIPEPGFYVDAPGRPCARNVVRKGYGRVAFGCAELTGHQTWFGAFNEARRATLQLA